MRYAVGIVATTLLAFSLTTASAESDQTYVEKLVGTRIVRLPNLAGFSPACEQSRVLAERAAALTPKTSSLLTCFIEESKFRAFREGSAADFYPYLVIAAVPPHPSGPYTSAEFEKLRQAAHAQLGDLLMKPGGAQARLTEQDKRISAKGGDLERKNYQHELNGFFGSLGETESFSYLTTRSATISEAGISKQVCEVTALSTILFEGRLLLATVVDQCEKKAQGLIARDITTLWLHAFSEANRVRK